MIQDEERMIKSILNTINNPSFKKIFLVIDFKGKWIIREYDKKPKNTSNVYFWYIPYIVICKVNSISDNKQYHFKRERLMNRIKYCVDNVVLPRIEKHFKLFH